MGKNVDFSARLVISCMDIQDSHTPDEMVATFDKSIAPLFAIIKCFAPFIINGVEEIIKDFLQGSEYVIINENGYISKDKPELAKTKTSNQKYRRVKLASDWQKVLTLDYINNLIELYHDSHEHRLDLFTLPLEDGGNVPVGFYVNDDQNIDLEVDILTAGAKIQPLRLVHLFYIAAVNKIADKHIYITRYPIEDHNNTYPSRMNIIPYARTGKVMVGDTVYDHFPIVNYEEDMKNIYSMFIDSLIIFPGFLSALDGDFDGDQLSIIGIFTKEANQEAENFIHSVSNMISIDGSTSRELGKLCGHVIHIMTI